MESKEMIEALMNPSLKEFGLDLTSLDEIARVGERPRLEEESLE